MANGEEGIVFILNNPSLKANFVKIGCATSIAEIRSIIAANKATPKPDEIYATLKTSKYEPVARLLGTLLYRLTGKTAEEGNGYFEETASFAADLLEDIADIADNARIDYYVDNQPVDDEPETVEEPAATSHKKPRFRFSMVGLKPGDTITFIPTGIQVRVASDSKVEYNGNYYKLSPFVRDFIPESMRNDSGAYQGSKFFSYNGKTLDDMRKERGI